MTLSQKYDGTNIGVDLKCVRSIVAARIKMAFVVECGLKIENKKSKFKDEADRRALSIDSLKESPERTKRNQLTVIKDLVDEESDSDEANHDSLPTTNGAIGNNGWTLDKKIKKKM